jgi:hypothetical protein
MMTEAARHVLVHNAGTDVDAILQKCFPGGWANFDGPTPEFFIHHAEFELLVANRLHLKAVSSHQIRLPMLRGHEIAFLPIVFIRRPELRAAAMWQFERSRNDTDPATIFARDNGFRAWILEMLKPQWRDKVCDGQTLLFGFRRNTRVESGDPALFANARANISALPFVGIVERFQDSMKRLVKLYAPHRPEFKAAETSRTSAMLAPEQSVAQELARIENELGPLLFRELQGRNAHDIALYEIAMQKFNAVNDAPDTAGPRSPAPAAAI